VEAEMTTTFLWNPSDDLTTHLRRCLRTQLDDLAQDKQSQAHKVLSELREWVDDRRIENLAEWVLAADAVPEEGRAEVLRRIRNAGRTVGDGVAFHDDAELSGVWVDMRLTTYSPTVTVTLKATSESAEQVPPPPTSAASDLATLARYVVHFTQPDDAPTAGREFARGWQALVQGLQGKGGELEQLALLGVPPELRAQPRRVDNARTFVFEVLPELRDQLHRKPPAKAIAWTDDCDWLLHLAGHYLAHQAKRLLDNLAGKPLVPANVRGTDFVKLPQAIGGMAWSIGSAIAIPDPNYALVPEAASRESA
jgi:hypothetical protein